MKKTAIAAMTVTHFEPHILGVDNTTSQKSLHSSLQKVHFKQATQVYWPHQHIPSCLATNSQRDLHLLIALPAIIDQIRDIKTGFRSVFQTRYILRKPCVNPSEAFFRILRYVSVLEHHCSQSPAATVTSAVRMLGGEHSNHILAPALEG